MEEIKRKTHFPRIDRDPHFTRVVRYFRPSDYGTWAVGTAAFPSILYALDLWDPIKHNSAGLARGLRFGTAFGFVGGFLLAYQNSSLRLWGWKENAKEVARAQEEGIEAVNKPSSLDQYIQDVAYRNSAWSQLNFAIMPWFNLVNHKHHGPPPSGDEE